MLISLLQPNYGPHPCAHSAAVSRLCQRVPFASIFLPPSPLSGQPPPLLFTQHTRSPSELCCGSAVTHLLLRYFGFITLQPVYPEEPHRANTEKRGNGGVRMGGSGAEIQGLLWKNSGEVPLPKLRLKEQGHSKQREGNRALIKTSLRRQDTPPRVLPQHRWNVQESRRSVIALWEYQEQPHPS